MMHQAVTCPVTGIKKFNFLIYYWELKIHTSDPRDRWGAPQSVKTVMLCSNNFHLNSVSNLHNCVDFH